MNMGMTPPPPAPTCSGGAGDEPVAKGGIDQCCNTPTCITTTGLPNCCDFLPPVSGGGMGGMGGMKGMGGMGMIEIPQR
jgi:hypothetical protein